ncbi:beta-lactamase family protein [Cohnella ginsengisoli]|uniref:Beta-lactamase family protein n=1 Tax=Cohnella ginsengisoli TaxID=425004 RepID=A0A9X4KCY4_9BACL|nr:serine hydrolase [Cohnella ginsengisoli]MDG0789746.1 beta-lactamase family protein [Cohnella ginsengisoli]
MHTITSHLPAAIASLNPRSCLVKRQGRLLFEHYREPSFETVPAIINSCTKSVLSALVCVALGRGLLPDPRVTPVSAFFPQLKTDADIRKRDMTLLHLLTMTAGFRWDEFGGLNSFPRMTRESNWIAHVLEQPLSEPPGTRMTYNSGVSQLLSGILSEATGMTVARFAEQTLFGTLGIETYEWETDPQGIHTGGFGLRLRPADLLKLGELMLNRGMHGRTRLFPGEWADLAVRPFAPASPPYEGEYGWHWWCGACVPTRKVSAGKDDGNRAQPSDYFYARGFGGQFVYVVPEAELVAVVTQDSRKRKQPDPFAELIVPILAGC